MAEGDSIEQKSEASTIEVTQENGPKNKKRKPRSSSNLSSKETTCKVILLDGTEYESQVNVSYFLDIDNYILDKVKSDKFWIQRRTKGGELFDKVCDHLSLLEKDYFGLSYRDHEEARVRLAFLKIVLN